MTKDELMIYLTKTPINPVIVGQSIDEIAAAAASEAVEAAEAAAAAESSETAEAGEPSSDGGK